MILSQSSQTSAFAAGKSSKSADRTTSDLGWPRSDAVSSPDSKDLTAADIEVRGNWLGIADLVLVPKIQEDFPSLPGSL